VIILDEAEMLGYLMSGVAAQPIACLEKIMIELF
jgi:hypothetical protein